MFGHFHKLRPKNGSEYKDLVDKFCKLDADVLCSSILYKLYYIFVFAMVTVLSIMLLLNSPLLPPMFQIVVLCAGSIFGTGRSYPCC